MIDELKLRASIRLGKANTKEDKQKFALIERILEDKDCFFKMDIYSAYSLLLDLGYTESQTKEMYLALIDAKNYKIVKK